MIYLPSILWCCGKIVKAHLFYLKNNSKDICERIKGRGSAVASYGTCGHLCSRFGHRNQYSTHEMTFLHWNFRFAQSITYSSYSENPVALVYTAANSPLYCGVSAHSILVCISTRFAISSPFISNSSLLRHGQAVISFDHLQIHYTRLHWIKCAGCKRTRYKHTLSDN